MQIPAPPHLSLFVKHFIYIDLLAVQEKKYRLFPNGNTGLVFTLNNNKFRDANNSILPYSYVFGQLTDTIDILIEGKVKVLIVVFQPFGLHQLTNIPGKELQNEVLEADLIFGKQVLNLHEHLTGLSEIEDIISVTEEFLLNQFLKSDTDNNTDMPLLVRVIIEKKGDISVKELVAYSQLHERKLQRLFLDKIGLTPKGFIQIVKLHYFIGLLKSGEDNLTSLAHEANYFDQSHLIKDFKKITSFTPTEYKNKQILAVNLIEVE